MNSKSKSKKLTAVLLSVILIATAFTSLPVTAQAASADVSAGASSGTTGNCSWSLDDSGVLTVSGSGAMANYSHSSAPWGRAITKVVISSGVTSVGYEAFAGCRSLSNVTIADTVTSIGYEAFADCSALTSVTIPDSVTTIYDYAFMGCTGLTSVSLGSGLTSIGADAFEGCRGLTGITIPDSVTTIGEEAFDGCTGLTSVTIPSGVKTIGDGAFSNCTGITSVTVPDSVTSLGEGAFSSCTGLTSATIGNGVTGIGEGAFEYCRNLSSLTLGNAVTSIGNGAFFNCISLTAVTVPSSVTSIGHRALGYKLKDSESKVSGFTITGASGSAAQTYATLNSFTFVENTTAPATTPAAEPATTPTTPAETTPATVNPAKVKLNKNNLTLGVNESYILIKTITPADAVQTVTWSTTDSTIASVGTDGKVTGKKAGSAIVTATTSNGLTASCRVKVCPAPTGVTINRSALKLGTGETMTVHECTNAGSYANAANITWTSSNTSVATITKTAGTNKAVITAVSAGTAIITVQLYNRKSYALNLTVYSAPTSVTVNPATLKLGTGEAYTISESTNSGSYANAAGISWTSSNTKVATVTKVEGTNKAVIRAKKAGSATITAKLYNGTTGSCTLTVYAAPKSVKLNKTSLTLKKGQSCTISETSSSGSYANAAGLRWTSSNFKIASVTKGSGNKATIKALKKGTTHIRIILYNGKTALCKVTVK